MTSHFLQHLKNCSEIVRTWPDWKQSVLGGRAETPPKHVSQSSNPKKAREVWDTIKDLPEIEDILKSLNLVYDGMTWNDHPEMDVSDWHLSQKFECEGKIEIQKYYCLPNFGWGLAFGFVISLLPAIIFSLLSHDIGVKIGRIDIASGRVQASQVTNNDGLTEWKFVRLPSNEK